jgi:hypothetical protein
MVVSRRTLPVVFIHALAAFFDDPGELISFFRSQRTRRAINDGGSFRITDRSKLVNVVGGALQPTGWQRLKIFDNGL